MDIRLFSAIFIGKLIAFLTKLRGSGATAAPGLYALKIDPQLIEKLTKKLKRGSIVVTGTNGKTTTSRLISEMLSKNLSYIHNRQGSNLERGIASTLIGCASILGKIKADIGLWEVDEAVFPQISAKLNPKFIILLNLFRDQLDRYGEVDTIRKKWQKALEAIPRDSTIIANSDDPQIAYATKFARANVLFFGVNQDQISLPETTNPADINNCLACGSELVYKTRYSSHIGDYSCTKCDFKRPNPHVWASNIAFEKDFSTHLKLNVKGHALNVNSPLPGLYNVYNITGAYALAEVLEIGSLITKALNEYKSAFGRFQKIEIGTKHAVIFLIKNPTGANEVIRTLASQSSLNLLAMLNDKLADGTDVSWVWDSDWEALAPNVKRVDVAGIRNNDLANRLKYAGVKTNKITTHEQINSSIETSLKHLDNKDTLIILPTYTALLSLQSYLAKKGIIKWHKS